MECENPVVLSPPGWMSWKSQSGTEGRRLLEGRCSSAHALWRLRKLDLMLDMVERWASVLVDSKTWEPTARRYSLLWGWSSYLSQSFEGTLSRTHPAVRLLVDSDFSHADNQDSLSEWRCLLSRAAGSAFTALNSPACVQLNPSCHWNSGLNSTSASNPSVIFLFVCSIPLISLLQRLKSHHIKYISQGSTIKNELVMVRAFTMLYNCLLCPVQ